MTRLVLASKSPRRKELLSLINVPFEIIVSEIEEHIDLNNDLVKEIEKLSFQKASAVFQNNKDAVVIGSDTIVKIGNTPLGKPHSIDDAKEMLRMLSGKTHEVVTGVTILKENVRDTFSSVAKVTFFELSEEEIEEYVNSGEPMDKAGSYAIQGLGAKFIKSIEGDYYSIVGLPIAELYHRLVQYL